MAVQTTKMSSKGQVVIPQDVREEIDADEGTIFAVISGKDSIILKKMKTPSKEELIREFKRIALEGSKRAEKLGLKESDVPRLINRIRKIKG